MGKRTTAVSREMTYETVDCDHCETVLLLDSNESDVDGIPSALTVVIGGGDHIATDKTELSARGRSYQRPRVVTKWFSDGTDEITMSTRHLCPSCARSLYGFEPADSNV